MASEELGFRTSRHTQLDTHSLKQIQMPIEISENLASWRVASWAVVSWVCGELGDRKLGGDEFGGDEMSVYGRIWRVLELPVSPLRDMCLDK